MPAPPTSGVRELARLGQATTGLPPPPRRDVRLLVDGAATYDALIEAAIARRTDHVHLEYYIYKPDQHRHAPCAMRWWNARAPA